MSKDVAVERVLLVNGPATDKEIYLFEHGFIEVTYRTKEQLLLLFPRQSEVYFDD